MPNYYKIVNLIFFSVTRGNYFSATLYFFFVLFKEIIRDKNESNLTVMNIKS